jgi:hypothetical protein
MQGRKKISEQQFDIRYVYNNDMECNNNIQTKKIPWTICSSVLYYIVSSFSCMKGNVPFVMQKNVANLCSRHSLKLHLRFL